MHASNLKHEKMAQLKRLTADSGLMIAFFVGALAKAACVLVDPTVERFRLGIQGRPPRKTTRAVYARSGERIDGGFCQKEPKGASSLPDARVSHGLMTTVL